MIISTPTVAPNSTDSPTDTGLTYANTVAEARRTLARGLTTARADIRLDVDFRRTPSIPYACSQRAVRRQPSTTCPEAQPVHTR
ncbi:MAG TPA: hypothetical protein VE642_02890, partial [Pyrinomonadaceae bacterium]|nr:hypothetical protein [Pyrinomonadaceae bacterium]